MSLAIHGLLPSYANRKTFNVPLFSTYILLHVVALAAPFTFSWEGLTVLCVLYFMTICLGITLCYHRLLTHQSYQLPKPLTYFLTLLGCLSLQRGPIWWTACHRLHHSKADKEGDPTSPRSSFLWAHWLWPFFRHPNLDQTPDSVPRLTHDLSSDAGMQFLEKNYTLLNVLFLALLFVLGYAWGGLRMGLSILVWGGFLRIIVGLNATWLVNSVAHIWGYRTYETTDTSRNNWWVALLTYGEGWHNNHHAHPRSARMGLAWYEIDFTYWLITLLKWLGLATNIVGAPPRPNHQQQLSPIPALAQEG